MTSNVLCRYYLQGACAFGDKCRFSHNKQQDEPSQVCRYYLAGNCAYGDKCRYQHSKPGWSGRGQPAPPSNYSAPSGVPRPPLGGSGSGGTVSKLPSGASEFGMVESAPNWDDFMTPDEMDEFEQWQTDQAMMGAAAARGSGQHAGEGGDFEGDGDIMDPAEIPLCNEFAATGGCSAGEECCYIHGDMCEICGYFCIHPYNPDVTAHHQLVCSEAMAAAAADYAGADGSCNGSAAAGDKPGAAPAAADHAEAAAEAADDSTADKGADAQEQGDGEGAAAGAAAGDKAESKSDAASAGAAADDDDELAEQLAEAKVSS